MQIINKLNEYISTVDPEWINRVKPTSEENLRLLKKYSGMDKENLDFPDAFVEFAKYAGEGDGGLLSETLDGWDKIFSIEDLVWCYKYEYEKHPEDLNPFEFEFLKDDLGIGYVILFNEDNKIYHGKDQEIHYDYGYISSSFEYLLFQCAVTKYEEAFYQEKLSFGASLNSLRVSSDRRKADILAVIMQELVEEHDLECLWFNDDYFFCAHSKEMSIILKKGVGIGGKIMGNNLQQMEACIKPLLYKIGGKIHKKNK